MSFRWREIGDLKIWEFEPWTKKGIRHGFLGVQPGLSERPISEIATEIATRFQIASLRILEQVHGCDLALGQERDVPKADGWVIDKSSIAAQGFGIVTADCLPILISGSSQLALVHAGWRGLANGIIEKTLEAFKGDSYEVLIGPAASGQKYEVGMEVIEAIGPQASYVLKGDRAYLSLEDTAANKIASIAQSLVHRSSICTIQNLAFHSYRREGKGCGRNLSYMILDN